MENIKKDYSKDIEFYKNQLEKSKYLYLKYSEQQFNLYNSLWRELQELKSLGNELWDFASFANLKKFARQLLKARNEVEKNVLLLEDEHYYNLNNLFDDFNNFEFNKKN